MKEQSGYPDYMLATANEIIDGRYADRPQLKLIFIAKTNAAAWFGELTIQARKTYVSLPTPCRRFACQKPMETAISSVFA